MREYLIFRLYGAMASWGEIAVGEMRSSSVHPSKSAVLGLIAAAMGIDRKEEQLHRRMAEGYGFAARIDCVGTPLADYHTAQVPPGEKQRNLSTRRDELLAVPKAKLKTILSTREYRMDALAVVALWARTQEPLYPLAGLAEALRHPVYTLYLGRKSCPLAIPLEAQIIQGNTLRDALVKAVFVKHEEFASFKRAGLYWEDGVEAGVEPEHVFRRRDVPLSRRRWQFDVRSEYHSTCSEED